MESIAQETVEFLYEENGGIPRDLHLPTMDDVKADLGKFSISHVKKGSVVVIQKELPYSRCGGRTLQKTQGLTGIVLDVDEGNDIIQVESYLQNEGALVRFWYPVVYLERPPPGYRKSSSLRGGDAASMLVHRQLLKAEASLVSMYSRRGLLTLHSSLERSGEELVEHLQLVSEECFAEPLIEGPTIISNPDLAPSPALALQHLKLSPLPLFYSDPERLSKELSRVLTTQPLGLVRWTESMCQCLLSTPEGFGAGEFKITDAKEVIDIANPDAAFILVSCVDDRAVTSKPPR
jgi:E3 ubiquitin-protein ligase HECTD4